MQEKRFLQGFCLASLAFATVLAGMQYLLRRIGEIDLDYAVTRQLAADEGAVLFSSGLNQHAYAYKVTLLDRIRPRVVAIGSSRAMQMQARFFNKPFVNMGGAVNNVAELERLTRHVQEMQRPALDLVLVFVDPWWFNTRYPASTTQEPPPQFPRLISADLAIGAAAAMRRGNWIAAARNSPDLGIHAILTDEGYSSTGSYLYTATISGRRPSEDAAFTDTLARIADGRDRFERNDYADGQLLERACKAIAALRSSAGEVVVVAPPFARAVWQRMTQGGYGYIAQAHERLRTCDMPVRFVDFIDPDTIAGSNDCEFVDGFHGGDLTYARMLRQIAALDATARQSVDTEFLDQFIGASAGHAAALTTQRRAGLHETDFLQLGCRK